MVDKAWLPAIAGLRQAMRPLASKLAIPWLVNSFVMLINWFNVGSLVTLVHWFNTLLAETRDVCVCVLRDYIGLLCEFEEG